jgi:hypothetical protein
VRTLAFSDRHFDKERYDIKPFSVNLGSRLVSMSLGSFPDLLRIGGDQDECFLTPEFDTLSSVLSCIFPGLSGLFFPATFDGWPCGAYELDEYVGLSHFCHYFFHA